MLNKGICNMNVPYKIFHQDLSTVVGAPEPKEDHNFTETVTTNKTVRMTGINFFFRFVTAVKNHKSFISKFLYNEWFKNHCLISILFFSL